MNFPPTSLVTLTRLLRRDGFAFFGKCVRYAFSRDAWIWLQQGAERAGYVDEDVELIKNSQWFDEKWFLLEHPEARCSGVSPAKYYLEHGSHGIVDPGPDFNGEEYLALNLDVKLARINPLFHFEKYGFMRYRQISFLESPKDVYEFPEGTIELRKDFSPPKVEKRRVAIFAAFSSNGRISETNLYYLRGLRRVADNIIFVCNSPIFPDEIDKLSGIVRTAVFQHHGEYDFGSYRRGYFVAKELGLLAQESTDELILANDSCYGPVVPFEKTFRTMASRKCDFWGLTAYEGFGFEHIQSYFFVFRRKVLDGGKLEEFLSSVSSSQKIKLDRWRVIYRYEIRLTRFLSDAGYVPDTLVPWKFYRSNGKEKVFPPARPVTLLKKYRMPIVKVKTVNGENDEGLAPLVTALKAANPELAAMIHPRPPLANDKANSHEMVKQARIRHQDSLKKTMRKVAEKVVSGRSIDVVFFVTSASMFPARPLFDAMVGDPAFSPRVVVIPDLRWENSDARMESCRAELANSISGEKLCVAQRDAWGDWSDETVDADIVCYSSMYDISRFRYNPHWAVGRDFLPIYVNYGVPVSFFGNEVMARQNYAYCWKVFFECESTADEYARHSILSGSNADVVGSVKMDALVTAKPLPRNGNRKRVLICPHHSVDGGANNVLALSNFQRYADYFLALPEKYPDLDFVFRPHPFLFTVLSNPSKWGPEKVTNWIASMKAHSNVRWSDEGDYFPVFASCDAIIQDCASFLFEWLFVGKPGCYMLKSPADMDAKFTRFGQQCLSCYSIAYDEPVIDSFLRDVVVGGSDPKAAQREEFRKTIMVNYPHAADAALASIKQCLGMSED